MYNNYIDTKNSNLFKNMYFLRCLVLVKKWIIYISYSTVLHEFFTRCKNILNIFFYYSGNSKKNLKQKQRKSPEKSSLQIAPRNLYTASGGCINKFILKRYTKKWFDFFEITYFFQAIRVLKKINKFLHRMKNQWANICYYKRRKLVSSVLPFQISENLE